MAGALVQDRLCSGGGLAAINGEHVTGDEAGLGRGQE
jgi:hypothetical protein